LRQSETQKLFHKDTSVVHLFKSKSDRHCCDNHKGISLCQLQEKSWHILLNRLVTQVEAENTLPESQCAFWSGRGTMEMVFSLRQIKKKCLE